MSNHIFRYPDVVVDLAVVDLEDEADEIRQDRGTAGLGFDWRCALASFWSYDWKTVEVSSVRIGSSSLNCSAEVEAPGLVLPVRGKFHERGWMLTGQCEVLTDVSISVRPLHCKNPPFQTDRAPCNIEVARMVVVSRLGDGQVLGGVLRSFIRHAVRFG